MRGSMHHLDLTVGDLGVSAPFYEAILDFMGYRRVRAEADGIDWDLPTPAGTCSIGAHGSPTPSDTRPFFQLPLHSVWKFLS